MSIKKNINEFVFPADTSLSNLKMHEQAGAELCQAQDKLSCVELD